MVEHADSGPDGPQDDHPTLSVRHRVEQHEKHVLVLVVARGKRRPLDWLTRKPLPGSRRLTA
jgi:hypothetical protein